MEIKEITKRAISRNKMNKNNSSIAKSADNFVSSEDDWNAAPVEDLPEIAINFQRLSLGRSQSTPFHAPLIVQIYARMISCVSDFFRKNHIFLSWLIFRVSPRNLLDSDSSSGLTPVEIQGTRFFYDDNRQHLIMIEHAMGF